MILNKAHGTQLGLDDFRYCYSLTRGKYGYSLGTRNCAPNLALTLLSSHKGTDADVVIILGFLEPDLTNKPISR